MMRRFRQVSMAGASGDNTEPAMRGAPRATLSLRLDGWTMAALVIAALAALPIVAILLAVPVGESAAINHLIGTVLPLYVANTAALMAIAGTIAVLVGTGCAWLVSAADFPGRRVLSWALVLPLAVPAYIAAYLYADLLDFSGPVQSALRSLTGWQVHDYAFPQIRSLWGGGVILGLVLYPYVYLLARASFAAQSIAQFHAARSLGASPVTAFVRVALPGARPAIAGGMALVLMETLADFGVSEYFAISTFSTGIFRSWLAMGDKQAAMGLAAMMLVFVIALVAFEAITRSGRSDSRDGLSARADTEPLLALSPRGKALALAACFVPVLLGFVIPAAHLASMAMTEPAIAAARDLASYAAGSAWLGIASAAMCCFAALLLVFAKTRSDSMTTKGAIRVSTLGYALPGALLAVGLLAPLGAFDQSITRALREGTSYSGGLLLTGTSLILIYALSVRFLTVAYNGLDAGMAKIPPTLDAAARSLGSRPARVLTRIYVPLLSPSLFAAAALVLIDTLRELPATLILRPFNLETLATRTYRLASDERLVEASLPALILLGAGLLPVLLLNRSGKHG